MVTILWKFYGSSMEIGLHYGSKSFIDILRNLSQIIHNSIKLFCKKLLGVSLSLMAVTVVHIPQIFVKVLVLSTI